MSSLKQGLIERRGLDTTNIREIQDLAQRCNHHDHLDLKLNWSILRDRRKRTIGLCVLTSRIS